ncbi:hypothetical protein [Nitratifractor salsuginis]|uniref:Peptidase n=1 Tax=Nitratifractor salsuginis (strain DSM 16511 / JCM 12458 / E9I37-1) TaxID=749222 RepID=E6WYU1_NITSE|nr:hypothetical protein [Nitratifractor salsuginis]ADV46527.1 hypothetical protein Nitsa_1275 [Nitratifractor salsuginis DSM 16511]
MKRSLLIGILSLAGLGLTACNATGGSPSAAVEAQRPAKAGADRDAHGCIASAGYRWCAKTQKCERPWELAKREGFAKTEETFDDFCGNR